uniref:Uncharacterized protein n=1 Tax=Plectus sambesii TaxID=2011161 RepID=A0A914X6V9_9BILA
MVPAASCDLLIPDVYTDEIKRQVATHFGTQPLSSSRSAAYSPIVQSASSGLSGFSKRRGLSAGSVRPVIGYRRSTSPGASLTSRSSLALMPANRYNSLSPSIYSPASSRNRQNKSSDNGSIFSNLYKTSQEMFFPTF